ncbi:MAG: ADP-ribosylation factor-like protein [Candidatus Hodarchaeota archaeon]
MLSNIFLLKGKNYHDLSQLDIYSYPEDIFNKDDKDFIRKIIYGHDQGSLIENSRIKKSKTSLSKANQKSSFIFDCPISQLVNNHNIYTIGINSKMIIGLIFDKDDNPYDYKEIFEGLSHELLNNENCCSFEDEIEIDNFLITLFIDIRRYGDEILQKQELRFQPTGFFTKVFLFGLDEVGKTSLVRRIKTGHFNDNFFAPSKKFNIEYIQRENGIFSVWDMAGQSVFRERWLKGLQDSNILIYMIDVANQLRFKESKREFWKILKNYEFSDIPLLILANKIDLLDLPKKKYTEQLLRTKEEILDFFEFDKLGARCWKLLFTSVKTNYQIEKLIEIIFELTNSVID